MAMLYGDEFGKTGTSCVMLAVTRQPGSNTIQVVDGIRALTPFFQRVIPPSVRMLVRGDRAQTIRQGFRDIQTTMLATPRLLILVIFLFLRRLPARMRAALPPPFTVRRDCGI